MGWRELRAWLREMNRQREVEAGMAQASPDSWDGNDGWFAAQREKHKQMRGR